MVELLIVVISQYLRSLYQRSKIIAKFDNNEGFVERPQSRDVFECGRNKVLPSHLPWCCIKANRRQGSCGDPLDTNGVRLNHNHHRPIGVQEAAWVAPATVRVLETVILIDVRRTKRHLVQSGCDICSF